MSKYARLTIIIAATLGLGACATDTATPDEQTRVLVWPAPPQASDSTTSPAGGPTLRPSIDANEIVLDPTDELAEVCACDGSQCLAEWIEGTFGCDICVSVDCPSTDIGGCVRCSEIPLVPAGTSRPLLSDEPADDSPSPVI